MKALWDESKPLTLTGLGMTAVFLAAIAAMLLDPRQILGAPAWLKPAKFAISTVIYSFTLAWIFTWLPERRRLKARIGWITSAVFVLEVAIIGAQAARGTTSHFNVATAMDTAMFTVMGIAIVVAWLASIALLAALFRHRFEDASMGWALRLGLLITVFGASFGGIMTTPTRAQLAEAHRTGSLPVSGAHTVGAPDGGPGMPGAGWSSQHGDLRVPHFFGLHAMQIIPLFAWLAGCRRPKLVVAAGAVYGLTVAVLLVQALAGRPLFPLG